MPEIRMPAIKLVEESGMKKFEDKLVTPAKYSIICALFVSRH